MPKLPPSPFKGFEEKAGLPPLNKAIKLPEVPSLPELPSLPSILSKLPFEAQLDRALDSIGKTIRENPVVKKVDEIQDRLPKIREVSIPTPLGKVKLVGGIDPWPRLTPPKMDARRKEAIKASIGVDLASLFGIIPGWGDYIEEELSDIYMHKLRNTLTPKELDLFQKYDKLNPIDTIACIRALVQADRKK